MLLHDRPFLPTGLGSGRRAVTSGTTITSADQGITVDATSGTFTIAITAAATLGSGFLCIIGNSGTGLITIDPSGSETIRTPSGSATSLTLAQGEAIMLSCTGTAFEAVFDSRSIAINIRDFGAVGDGVADDTAAFASAVAAGTSIHVPAGTYLVDTVALTANGYSLIGDGPRTSILKARTSASTKVLDIHGVSTYAKNVIVRDIGIDMTNMTNAATSFGLYMAYAYDCTVEQVLVTGNGALAHTLHLECSGVGKGVYTTVFNNCNFGSTTGIIRLLGNSLSDGITTLSFLGCSFAKCDADYCVSISFFQPIVQGALDKFDLANINGFSITSGDIEGSGTYLVVGSSVNHLHSAGNELTGFTGTYSSGTPASAILSDFYSTEGFTARAASGGSVVFSVIDMVVSFKKSAAALWRTLFENTNAVSQQVDAQFKNSNGSGYFGQNAAGATFVDFRGSPAQIQLQSSGSPRLTMTDSSATIASNITTWTFNAGTVSTTPTTGSLVNTGGFGNSGKIFSEQDVTCGTGSGARFFTAKGANSGTGGGSGVLIYNSTGTQIIFLGNRSALTGGAYSAVPTISVTATLELTGGALSITDTTVSSSPTSGSLIAAGGLGITKRSFLGVIASTFAGNVLAGVQDGTVAVAGQVGEVLSSTVSTYTNYTTTATYQAVTSLVLTRGDWVLEAFFTYDVNGATITAGGNAIFAISTTSASAAGTTEGLDIAYIDQNMVTGDKHSGCIVGKQVNVSSDTTYYLNSQAAFTLGNPRFVGSLLARRLR